MKRYIKNIVLMAAAALGFASCEDYPDAFVLADGVPTVDYVRYADRDVLIEQAFMGEIICFVGENLQSVRELYFNDQPAVLNTSFMTEKTLVAAVPGTLAKVTTDKAYLITKNQDTVSVDFRVLLPAPIMTSMSCEYQPQGTDVTIYGNYFKEPMSVIFEGGATVTSFKKVDMTEVTFTIPADAKAGRVKVETESGAARSPFMYLDDRGLITDFDGTTDVVPQGWNFSGEYKSEGGIDGNYVELKSASPLTASGWHEDFKIEFWCGNWGGDPMGITSGTGVPICYVVDFTDWANMALKFELCIPSSNPWTAASMQILFAGVDKVANDDGLQNNTYWEASTGICRALYHPWATTGSFDTADKWITVTIPFKEFTYNADGTSGSIPLQKPEDFASLAIWAWSGGLSGDDCNPIFRFDNIRAVPVK